MSDPGFGVAELDQIENLLLRFTLALQLGPDPTPTGEG